MKTNIIKKLGKGLALVHGANLFQENDLIGVTIKGALIGEGKLKVPVVSDATKKDEEPKPAGA